MKELQQTLQRGKRRSVDSGVTLSVFKRIVKPVLDDIYEEDDAFLETCGIEEEDLWTFRFESWCLCLDGWAKDYPVNEETLLDWAKEHYQIEPNELL